MTGRGKAKDKQRKSKAKQKRSESKGKAKEQEKRRKSKGSKGKGKLNHFKGEDWYGEESWGYDDNWNREWPSPSQEWPEESITASQSASNPGGAATGGSAIW